MQVKRMVTEKRDKIEASREVEAKIEMEVKIVIGIVAYFHLLGLSQKEL